jgi:hypothetical protein
MWSAIRQLPDAQVQRSVDANMSAVSLSCVLVSCDGRRPRCLSVLAVEIPYSFENKSLFCRKIPCSDEWEFAHKPRNHWVFELSDLQARPKWQNSLFFSLLAGNCDAERQVR